VALVAAAWSWTRDRQQPGDPGTVLLPSTPLGELNLLVDPAQATIQVDGRAVGLGQFRGSVAAGARRITAVAPGFADSSFVVEVAADSSAQAQVALRPLLGALRVDSMPAGAEIWLNGRAVGTAPVVLERLPIAEPQRIAARLPGYQEASAQVQLRAGATSSHTLTLSRSLTALTILSTPSEASIAVDGRGRGKTPLRLDDLTLGQHRFRAELAGHVARDSTLELDGKLLELRLELSPEPPGVLVVVGDVPARIYIDDRLVAMNLQNSGNQSLSPGTHQVEVVLGDGQSHRTTVELRSGVRVVYDFSRGTTTSSPQGQE
jgi:hypothetical protein